MIDQHDRDHHTRWRAEHPPRPAPAVAGWAAADPEHACMAAVAVVGTTTAAAWVALQFRDGPPPPPPSVFSPTELGAGLNDLARKVVNLQGETGGLHTAVAASVTAFQTLKGHVDTETTRLGAEAADLALGVGGDVVDLTTRVDAAEKGAASLAARVDVVEEGAALLDERVDDVVATVDENLERASQRFAWVGKTVKDGLAENSGRITALELAWEAFKRVG